MNFKEVINSIKGVKTPKKGFSPRNPVEFAEMADDKQLDYVKHHLKHDLLSSISALSLMYRNEKFLQLMAEAMRDEILSNKNNSKHGAERNGSLGL